MKPVSTLDVANYLSGLLKYHLFNDGSVNGLQVEAKETVSKIAVAVDFSLSSIEAAIKENADLLLTHHGFLWGSTPPLTGLVSKKVSLLYQNGLNVFGIHLPLDAHEEFGNNFIIARDLLKLKDLRSAVDFGGANIGCLGTNDGLSLGDIKSIFQNVDGALKDPLVLNFGPKEPNKICVVSGAAADAMYQYKNLGFDTLITGEPRQAAYHFCKEEKLNAIFAGHYATETFGVKALGQHLSEKYSIPWTFIDEPTGI